MRFTNIAARLIQLINPPQASNDSIIAEHDQRAERLKTRQKAMYDEMMANGTHMLCGKNYTPGDSTVLRSAGLVK